MAAKKRKSKNSSENKRLRWQLELPQEIIIELLPTKGKRNPLHYGIHVTGITKSLAPTTSARCGRERGPLRLRRVDESAYLKYFPGDCPFTAARVARVGDRIMTINYNQLVWAEYERTLARPSFSIRRDPLFQNVERNYMDITSLVSLEGKIYALTLQGTLVIVENLDSRRTITGVASNRAIPISLNWRFFKECLVDLDGEIFLVLFVHQKSLGIVDQVEVFRLCLRKIKWIKVERLGGKVLFLKYSQYVWVNSAEIGCKGDCIYFTQASSSGWLVYDVESGRISSFVS